MRILIFSISFLLAAAALSPCARAAPLLTVENVRWTNAVDPETRQFDQIYKSPATARQLVLWVQLNGSPALLAALKKKPSGSIPIKFMWYRLTNVAVMGEGVVKVPVGRKSELQKLTFESDAQGFFRWRVWSSKKMTGKGVWRADLLYADNEPVMCMTESEEKPCRFEIETR